MCFRPLRRADGSVSDSGAVGRGFGITPPSTWSIRPKDDLLDHYTTVEV